MATVAETNPDQEPFMTTSEIIKHVRSLPANERADIVDRLIVELAADGCEESVVEEWTEEVRRRAELSRSGQMQGTEWEEVRDDLRLRLNEYRQS